MISPFKTSFAFAVVVLALCSAAVVQAKPAGKSAVGALAMVKQFETAYAHKDKQTMLMKLMVPTDDNAALEKRYQWLRGYGPHDMPGSVHPPILFKSSKGSFVPSGYTVQKSSPAPGNRYNVIVRETGTYHDEDGRYLVTRIRHFKMTIYKGKWYVMDYVLEENQEDYGFFVDDIVDKMVHLGK